MGGEGAAVDVGIRLGCQDFCHLVALGVRHGVLISSLALSGYRYLILRGHLVCFRTTAAQCSVLCYIAAQTHL